MAAFRSQRVTRSSVGSNGLDENFCGRTLRNRSIVHSEDSSPLSHLRSRSPKKKQDGIQQQKGTNGGRVTECKQQSVRESWVSPRKRGLSCSEKDNNEKKALDICDTVSPVFKRVKRCSRSETIDGSEDVSPVKNEKQPLERKSLAVNNDGDSSQLKRARRFLLLDDCDKREVKKGKDLDNGQNSSVLPVEVTAHQTSNGINEKDAAVPEFSECESIHLNNKPKCVDVDTCTSVLLTEIENSNSCDHSVLLNGSKIVTVSEPDVPCTDSEWEGYSIVSDCPSVSQTSQSQQSTAVLAIENPSQIRESEEEVDVVGDSSCQLKEQCFENANCSIDTAQDIEQFSGVTDSSAVLDSGLVPLAEPQEHRYALRTSPRRAAAVKCSPQKINSPLRDNGQPEDKIPSLNEMEKAVGTVAAGTEHCMEFEEDSQSKRDLPQDSVGECFNGNMSNLPTDLGLGSGHLYTSRESSSQQTREEEEEEPDVYYFESDHVALKHNKDYQRLLQTIAVLEAQRAQAVQDLENLSKHQKEALKDPITFVENLQQKIDMELPCSQRVVQLPQIPWDHYTSGLGNFEKEYRNKKHNTRRLKLIFDKRLPLRPKSPVDSKKDGESSSSSSFYCSTLPSSDTPEVMATNSRTQVIRGRICDDSKSETYNQLWSIEEQKRLEELLLKYPPEEVETRRWQKVADELGSRTAKQVASRVQKYFIKLAQAGIPVPGRTPNLYLSSKKASNRQQHPLNKHLFRPSTFMTSHQAPVYMDDEDDRSSFYSSQLDASADCEVSDDESIPPAYRLTPEYKELLRLKKMKKHKLDQMQAESGFVQHIGFKCDNCGTDPILGVRWHCQDCPPDGSVDFCDSCSDCLYETESHKGDHQLEPIYRVETFLDRDYCLSQSTGYNYLDPNYYPANR